MQSNQTLVNAQVFRIAAAPTEWVGVTVQGTSPSAGQTVSRLTPWLYDAKPSDNIQDFDLVPEECRFVRIKLNSFVTDFLLERSRTDYWGRGNDLCGVRIHSRGAAIEACFSDQEPVDAATLPPHIQTSGTPWSWVAGRIGRTADPDAALLDDAAASGMIGTRLRTIMADDVAAFIPDARFTTIAIDPVTRLIERVWVGLECDPHISATQAPKDAGLPSTGDPRV